MNGRYRVVDNTQVNVDGRVYIGGETVMLDNDTAKPWLAANYIVAADDTPPAPKRTRKRAAE